MENIRDLHCHDCGKVIGYYTEKDVGIGIPMATENITDPTAQRVRRTMARNIKPKVWVCGQCALRGDE